MRSPPVHRRKFSTLGDPGISPSTLALTKPHEIPLVGSAGLLLALALTALVQANAQAWVRLLLA